ncbi:MAG: hypothetical protein MZV70_05475 [Desulfobacterales bacterium]|nr:hypothetical protein [Desulfobacterales bacterium]
MTAFRHIDLAYETWSFPSREAWLRARRASSGAASSSPAACCSRQPARTPLRARIFDRTERWKPTASRRCPAESWPGFFVTGKPSTGRSASRVLSRPSSARTDTGARAATPMKANRRAASPCA